VGSAHQLLVLITTIYLLRTGQYDDADGLGSEGAYEMSSKA
jgi:hypothetical protein